MKLSALGLVLLSCLPVEAARFDIADVARIVRVSDPQIAPDGKSIVIVVSRPNYDLNLHQTEVALVDIASHHERMLTHDRKGVSYPRWSPSGDTLAYLVSDMSNKGLIFLMPMTGGDSMQLTKVSSGVQQFAWSPDGKSIAFAASEEAPKKTGPNRFDDAFEVGNNDFLVTAKPLPTHLWLISAAGGDARRLTSGNWTLPISHPPSSPASPITWSPDSRSIAFVKIPTPYSSDADQSTLQLLDIASGTFKPVTGRAKQEAYPSFSPDGAHLAYWYPRDGQPKNGTDIQVINGVQGEGSNVTRSIDRNLQRAIWMPR